MDDGRSDLMGMIGSISILWPFEKWSFVVIILNYSTFPPQSPLHSRPSLSPFLLLSFVWSVLIRTVALNSLSNLFPDKSKINEKSIKLRLPLQTAKTGAIRPDGRRSFRTRHATPRSGRPQCLRSHIWWIKISRKEPCRWRPLWMQEMLCNFKQILLSHSGSQCKGRKIWTKAQWKLMDMLVLQLSQSPPHRKIGDPGQGRYRLHVGERPIARDQLNWLYNSLLHWCLRQHEHDLWNRR